MGKETISIKEAFEVAVFLLKETQAELSEALIAKQEEKAVLYRWMIELTR